MPYKYDLNKALKNMKQAQNQPVQFNAPQEVFVPTKQSMVTGDKSHGDTLMIQPTASIIDKQANAQMIADIEKQLASNQPQIEPQQSHQVQQLIRVL